VLERQKIIGTEVVALRLKIRTALVFRDDHLDGVAFASDVKLVTAANAVDGFVFGEALVETGVCDTSDVCDALECRVLCGARDRVFQVFFLRSPGCEHLRVVCTAANLRGDRCFA